MTTDIAHREAYAKLFDAGEKVTAIAKKFKVSKQSVSIHLQAMGRDPAKRRREASMQKRKAFDELREQRAKERQKQSDDFMMQMAHLWRDGASVATMAERAGYKSVQSMHVYIVKARARRPDLWPYRRVEGSVAQEIIDDHQNGKRISDIVKDKKVTKASVLRVLEEAGISARRHPESMQG
jgi:transposase